MDKPKPPPAKVPFANRPPLEPGKTSSPTTSAPTPTPPKLGAQPLPQRPVPTAQQLAQKQVQTAPTSVPGAKQAAIAKLLKVAKDEMTWAEAIGLTRHEAFGMAQAAHRMFEHGMQERGRKGMEALVELNPLVGAFHALLGGMAGRMGDEALAEQCYSKAIELEPGNLAARVNRAEMLLKKGKVADALDDLIAATKIDPKAKSPLGKRAYSLARVTSTALRELIAKAPKKPSSAPAKR